MISPFFGKYEFLRASVHCPEGIYLPGDDRKYKTVLAAYSAARTFDQTIRDVMWKCEESSEAFAIAQALNDKTIRPDWNIVRHVIMEHLLKQKFKVGSAFAEQLIATKDEEICVIEGVECSKSLMRIRQSLCSGKS